MNPEVILPMSVFMDIERSGPIPIYFQVSQRIEKAIQDGSLPAGSRLENEIALGDRLGLSRPTVRRAIQELVAGINTPMPSMRRFANGTSCSAHQ